MNKVEEVITIAKMGEKDNKFWIQDQNGEFYSGFKEWEGTPNTEYAQLTMGNHNEPFREGDQAMVVFTKTVGKDDKVYKNLKAIYPAGDNSSSQQKSSSTEANNASQGASHEDFWEKKAYKQCLWNYWLNGKRTGVDINAKLFSSEMEIVWEVFKQIEADADNRFSVSDEVTRTEPAPDIADMAQEMEDEPLPEDPLDSSDIPF